MSGVDDVLDLIDNTIADHDLGPDAVRWTPGGHPQPGINRNGGMMLNPEAVARLNAVMIAVAESCRATLAPLAADFARLAAALRPPSAIRAERYARARRSRAQYGKRYGHGR